MHLDSLGARLIDWEEKLAERGALVTVDPSFPNAWRREPYYLQLLGWAQRMVVEIRVGRRCIRLNADGSEQEATKTQAWLEDREERLSVATERRYLEARAQLLSALILFFGDAIRLQQDSAQLELVSLTPLVSEFARSLTTPDALRRLTALEDLADHLARNVQESLAIEVACVKAFGPG